MFTLALGRTIWTLVGKVRKCRLRIWKRKRGEEGRECVSKCEGACRLGNQQKRLSHVKEKQLRILLLTIRHSWQTLSLEESPQTPLHASLISTESLPQRIPQTCQSTLKSFCLISLQNSGDLTPPQTGTLWNVKWQLAFQCHRNVWSATSSLMVSASSPPASSN